MHNENEGGASGGGGWSSYLPVAATAVGLSTLCWMIHDIRKKDDERQMKIRRNQLYIQNDQNLNSIVAALIIDKTLLDLTDRKKALNTIQMNRLCLAIFGDLDEVEDLLVERQHLFCSRFKPKSQRLQIEEQIKNKVSEFMPTEVPRFDEVLAEDVSCASCLTYLWTRDKRRNGGLMWDLLRDLRREIIQGLQKKKIENLLTLNEDSGQHNSSSDGS